MLACILGVLSGLTFQFHSFLPNGIRFQRCVLIPVAISTIHNKSEVIDRYILSYYSSAIKCCRGLMRGGGVTKWGWSFSNLCPRSTLQLSHNSSKCLGGSGLDHHASRNLNGHTGLDLTTLRSGFRDATRPFTLWTGLSDPESDDDGIMLKQFSDRGEFGNTDMIIRVLLLLLLLLRLPIGQGILKLRFTYCNTI